MLKFEVSRENVDLIFRFLDIAVKQGGINYINQIIELINIMNTPEKQDESIFTYSLKDEDVRKFVDVLDIVLKTNGMQDIYNVIALINLFSNPVKEDRGITLEE